MSSVPASGRIDLAMSLQQTRAGSRAAADELFSRCRDYLLYIANREMSDDLRAKVGASDIVQESMVKAHQNLATFQGETEGELFSWLRQILIRTFLDARRRFNETGARKLDREVTIDRVCALASSAETPSVQLMAKEGSASLQAALDQLREDYRRVVWEHTWERKSFVTIGAEMDRSPDAVRKLWFRGIDQLRKNWQAMNGGDSLA